MEKVIYTGSSNEVELLMTGKTFKQNEPVKVTKEEYDAIIHRDDFKVYKPKKKDTKGEDK